MVFRGSSDDEPSPVNRACRNARLNAALPRHTRSGTCFARLVCPTRQASGDARRLVMSWMSSSRSRLPERIVRS